MMFGGRPIQPILPQEEEAPGPRPPTEVERIVGMRYHRLLRAGSADDVAWILARRRSIDLHMMERALQRGLESEALLDLLA